LGLLCHIFEDEILLNKFQVFFYFVFKLFFEKRKVKQTLAKKKNSHEIFGVERNEVRVKILYFEGLGDCLR